MAKKPASIARRGMGARLCLRKKKFDSRRKALLNWKARCLLSLRRLIMMTSLLIMAFFLTALIYSMAGFAGGSTYLALMMLWELPQPVIPVIALLCNVIVSSGNSLNYIRAGLVRPRLLIPHSLLAIPFAYIGGSMELDKGVFELLIASSLLVASLFSIFRRQHHDEETCYVVPPLWLALLMGGALGFLAGVAGIGGGVFLAPFLYVMRAGNPREIASTCTLFIFFNSIAGLWGQFHKLGSLSFLEDYWVLPLVVLFGGAIGSQMTLKMLSPNHTARYTHAFLFLFACRLWYGILV